MKELFKSIRDTIAAVVGIQWVDYDMGQLDVPTPPVSWPCALFSLQSAEYEQISSTNVAGTVAIEVAVGFRLRERTHSKADPTYSDEALEHIDVVELVKKALIGLSGSTWAPIDFLGFSQDKRSDYRVWRLRFSAEHFPPAVTQPDTTYTLMDPQPDFCAHPDIL